MTSITTNPGFAADFAMLPSQLSLTAASGTVPCGHPGVIASSGESTPGTGIGTGGTWGASGSRRQVSRVERTGDGSGVPATLELARDRGKPMAEHAEATHQRLYGASGECPRRNPA
ncbi:MULTISPECIES: hypothetical protein [unclassified Nocardiopsis]|uniref:hypothetical protein n=1 Tax=unclassified Nocardiopsis TaxID=2649073 RepID=UPI00135AF23D|nr:MULTISPECIES: hypothetical protein [unclassified Nocardiopsis]